MQLVESPEGSELHIGARADIPWLLYHGGGKIAPIILPGGAEPRIAGLGLDLGGGLTLQLFLDPETGLVSRSLGFLNVRGMNNNGQNQSQRVDDKMPLATVDLLSCVIAVRPPFSVVFTLWLSTIAAECDFFRPTDTRTLSRRAS